jgi:hypothetical protein
MMQYPWAANRLKLERALEDIRKDLPPFSQWEASDSEAFEKAVKARYIEMAGKVLADDGTSFSEKEVAMHTICAEHEMYASDSKEKCPLCAKTKKSKKK